jgi:hypothetical protein
MITGEIIKPYDVYPQAALVLILLFYVYNYKIYWVDAKYVSFRKAGTINM